MKTKNPILRLTGQASLVTLAAFLMAPAARAANAYWGAVPGASTDTNWSDTANWPEPPGTWTTTGGGDGPTYYNQVFFTGIGANPNNDTAVNNVLDTTSTGAVMPIWELDFVPTNGNYTTLINPGITMQIAAGNGNFRVGADIQHTSTPAPANAVETITFEGPGATLNMDGNLYVGQGSLASNDTHNVTLDLSGLDNFEMTANNNYIYLAASAAPHANGVLYLAKTNNIVLGNGIQMCNQGSSSNSMPVELFLGINNTIELGSSGNFNIGQSGTTTNGACLEFNPAFLGGATPPTAVFDSAASGGRINNFYVCNVSQAFAGYALCNLSGGVINAAVATLQVALAGSTGSSTGALTFDMGIINTTSANVGVQGSSGGGAGVGTVNINSNSTYGASATLVAGTLSLATVSTGTLTPGTAGTININGGTLSAGTIVNGAGAGSLNVAGGTFTLSGSGGTATSPISNLSLSNATVNLVISSAPTNIFAGTLDTSGTTNVINITTAPLFSSYPATISLIKYQGSIGGAGYNFGLGTLPNLYAGHLVNNTANGSVDLVLTSGPSAETWTDAAGNNNWDTTSANWSGATSTYVDGDAVRFLDGAASGSVNLTAIFNPNSVIVSNNALAYTWSSSGAVSGTGALTKNGPGTFVIDNSGNNSFSGGVTISGGILQVGNGDTSGNLPNGNVTDNGVLVYDRTDNPINSDTISGSGAVVQAGTGGTLQLAGGNTFSGPVGVTNNSTLQLGGSTAAGTGTNDIIVSSGSTLDVNGYTATKPIVISGTGVSGSGALIDSGGAIYDNPGPAVATNITLAGDTTFLNNSPSRWDLGSRNGTACVLSGAYNLTLNGNGYFEWANLDVTNVANITIASGTMGVIGNTTFGNPADTLVITASGTLQFYGANDVVNKAVDFQNGGNIINSGSANVMTGPMTLEPGVETINIGSGTSLTLSNSLSGSGFLVQSTGTGTSALSGNSPSFVGDVVLNSGQMALNGLIGSGISSASGTTLMGTGTADGLVDVSGAFVPGSASSAGTFNAAGGLTIESGATMTMNLGTATTPGGGTNSLVNVTGNLTFNANNFNISINPFKGYLASGTYTLFNYTGTLTVSGTLTASPASPSVYTFTIVTNATQVLLTVSGQGDLVEWNNNANNGQWDVATSINWTNLTTLSNSVYLNPDTVVFDNSILTAAHPTNSIVIPSGTVVVPAVITNNSTTNYTIGGSGQIAGGASIIKMGTSTLTISNANTFDGNTVIGGGALQIDGQVGTGTTPLGATNGSIIISNGATLYVDLTGSYPPGDAGFGGKPIIISGAGVNGQGAIQNIGNALYDDGSTLGLGVNVTMAGDATIGGTSRLDWGYPGTGATLSTSGSNYNLTVIENQYFRWDNFLIDTNLGNIDVSNSAASLYTWELDGMGGSLGNPTNILTVHSNVQMEVTDNSPGSYPGIDDSGYGKVIHVLPTAVYVNAISGGSGDYRDSTSFILEGGSLFNYYDGTGGNNTGTAFSGTVVLNGLVDFEVGNSLLTFSNVISGSGGFYMSNYGGNPPLTFAAANTYTGITDIRSGNNFALIGNGSISDSTPISLATSSLLIVTNRVDGTLTLVSGQTLEGAGTVQGILVADAGSTLIPGVTSTATNVGSLSVSGAATLSGNILMKLTNSASDNLTVGGLLTYGGTLTVTNISSTPLAAGNSFKLFTAGSYTGAFSSISLPSPGAGLAWNTSNLAVNGTLSVVATTGPKITSITVNGSTLTITANGSANEQYVLMESTNVLTPLPWAPVLTNTFNNSGVLNLSTNIINPNTPEEYYILQVQ
ncbi:MAG TPA: autotransporter-associated beta strand repeat-containing protein [Candidatus Sulfotelmatobacter sp.]|nr:autotransporter-associated beta strand repeat-containing protein [Candidatus Sulfotelmatobacter sp.]